jgi:hypothetical protein
MLSLLLTCSLLTYWAILGRSILGLFIPRVLGILRPWLLAPAVGFATISLPLAVLNQMGYPIKSFAWILSFGLLIFAVFSLKIKRTIFPTKALLPILGILVFSLFWTAWPAIRFNFNWVSIVNDDYCNYCLAAERFKDFGFYHVPTHADFLGRDYAQYYWLMHAIGLIRFGSEQALAWVASLVPLPTLEIFMPTIMGFALAQICAASALVLIVGRKRNYAYWTAAFLSISPMFLYGSLYQLIAQVSGITLLLTLVTLLTSQINTRKRWVLFKYAIPVSIVSASLCMFYPEVTPFAILAIIGYQLVKWFRTRNFPGAHIVLIQYSIICTIIFLRYNFISFLYTLAIQFAGASKKIDLSLSIFPFFLVPSGLASLFGFQPMMEDIRDPWVSMIIILGFLLLLLSIYYVFKSSLALAPAAILLGVELLMAAWLYYSGYDFGLYKIVMYMQPVLMAAVASSILESRIKRYIALLTLLYLGITAYTSIVYTRGSCGSGQSMVAEVGHASELFSHRPIAPKPKEHWTSTIDNVSAAKLAAGLYRSTDISFLSRDYFLNLLIIAPNFPYLKLYPNYSQFSQAIDMVESRQQKDFISKKVFDTQFVEVVENNSTAAFLDLSPQLSLFNKFNKINADRNVNDLFSLEQGALVSNRLLFIHSSRGNQYYLGDRHKISYFQQELDYYGDHTGFNGIGQFMLLRIEKPSPRVYLRVSATKTLMDYGNKTWSKEAKIMGTNTVSLGALGSGALNLIAGPITPFILDGASYIALDFNQSPAAMPNRRNGIKALYNASINLDYRRLVAYGRDISALSEDEVRTMERARGLSSFPSDIVMAKGLEYSGIYEDGWLSPDSHYVLAGAESNDQLRIKGFIPSITGITQNNVLTIRVNQNNEYQVHCGPGAFDWAIPFDYKASVTTLEIHSSEHAQLAYPDQRPVCAHLTYLGLDSKKAFSYDYTDTNIARPFASGIAQDGWASTTSKMTIPVDGKTRSLLFKVEYPDWEGIPSNSDLMVYDEDYKITHSVLKYGSNDIIVPCKYGSSHVTVRFECKQSFILPNPDLRHCSFRLLSIKPLK